MDNSYLEVSQASHKVEHGAPPPPPQLTHTPGGPGRCTVSISSPPRRTFVVHLCVCCVCPQPATTALCRLCCRHPTCHAW